MVRARCLLGGLASLLAVACSNTAGENSDGTDGGTAASSASSTASTTESSGPTSSGEGSGSTGGATSAGSSGTTSSTSSGSSTDGTDASSSETDAGTTGNTTGASDTTSATSMTTDGTSTDGSTGTGSTEGSTTSTTGVTTLTGTGDDGDTTGGGLEPLLWSTLDDAAAITSPMVGTGIDAGHDISPANDFVPGKSGSAIVIDEDDEWARFRMVANGIYNAYFDRGTVEFWFQPVFMSLDGKQHRLLALGSASGAGILVRKGPQNAGNQLQVMTYSAGSLVGTTAVSPNDFWFFSGTWVKIRITWDFTVGVGTQNVRIYINGSEATYAGTDTGPVAMPLPTSEYIWVGAYGINDSSTATGVFDELLIWGEPLPP